MRCRPRLALSLFVLWAPTLSWNTPAQSLQEFDFDQRYFAQPGVIVKDHSLIQAHDGTYHLFYTQGDLSVSEGQRAKSLGHATSTDLMHWTIHPNVIFVVPNSWEESFIWAPHVVQPSLDGQALYYMFYTGVNRYYSQATGLATSDDLFNWTKWPSNPVYKPDTSWASWTDSTWSNCRDPYLFFENGNWYMLSTAHTADLKGALALAISENLTDWQDAGPLFVHPGPNAWHVLESANLHRVSGNYHLFFTEEGVGGTSYLQAGSLFGPWDYTQFQTFDAGHASEIRRVGGDWLLSRHSAFTFLENPLYSIKIDDLAWQTTPPVITSPDPMQSWAQLFGNVFHTQPTFWDNTTARGADPAHFIGNSWIGTNEYFRGPLQAGDIGSVLGEEAVGIIRSPTFRLTGDRIAFRIGGGSDPGQLFLAMYTNNGFECFRATANPVFSETMEPRVVDVSLWTNLDVYFIIADLSAQGHLNVDEIREYVASDATDTVSEAPSTVRLLPNTPNPFNPSTTILFDATQAGHARLDVYDVRGRFVDRLLDGQVAAGQHRLVWNGTSASRLPMPAGVYFCRLEIVGQPVQQQSMVLVK